MLEAVPVAAQEASPAVAPTGDPIKIGSPYNLTGGYASIDNPAANGSRLAVKEINEAGGVLGRPLEIIIEDGKSDVPTITSVAKKLVEEDGVHVMAGLTDTSYMLAAGPVAQEGGIPFLDVGGTAPRSPPSATSSSCSVRRQCRRTPSMPTNRGGPRQRSC
jgi:branched-chain amino acid transport system substrate-binding protein